MDDGDAAGSGVGGAGGSDGGGAAGSGVAGGTAGNDIVGNAGSGAGQEGKEGVYVALGDGCGFVGGVVDDCADAVGVGDVAGFVGRESDEEVVREE